MHLTCKRYIWGALSHTLLHSIIVLHHCAQFPSQVFPLLYLYIACTPASWRARRRRENQLSAVHLCSELWPPVQVGFVPVSVAVERDTVGERVCARCRGAWLVWNFSHLLVSCLPTAAPELPDWWVHYVSVRIITNGGRTASCCEIELDLPVTHHLGMFAVLGVVSWDGRQ